MKKEYWVFVKNEAGNWEGTRFSTLAKAEKYAIKHKEAYIKTITI